MPQQKRNIKQYYKRIVLWINNSIYTTEVGIIKDIFHAEEGKLNFSFHQLFKQHKIKP